MITGFTLRLTTPIFRLHFLENIFLDKYSFFQFNHTISFIHVHKDYLVRETLRTIMVHRATIQKMVSFFGGKHFDKVINKVKVLSAGDGKCEVEMKVEEEHTNAFGTLHGGLSATLVDIISGYALLTHPKLVDRLETFPNAGVSVDLHMTYLRAANIGDEILVQANTVKTGKTLAFLEVVIRNKATNDVLIKGSHTKFVGQ